MGRGKKKSWKVRGTISLTKNKNVLIKIGSKIYIADRSEVEEVLNGHKRYAYVQSPTKPRPTIRTKMEWI